MDRSTPVTTDSTAVDSKTWAVFGYFAPLTLLLYLSLPNGYGFDVAMTFILKDHLHATAEQVARFRMLMGIPLYFGFCFGLARDLWNPFGLRDRGFLMLFGSIVAVVFVWLSLTPLTLNVMLAGMLLAVVSFAFISSAYQGLLALVGQERLMSGRLSVLWNTLINMPFAIAALAAGYVADHLSPQQTFQLAAGLGALIALYGALKPRSVYDHTYDQPVARGTTLAGDLRRLFRHRAIYPPVLIIFMFQFSPGSNTPLQYYLTDVLHAPDSVYGAFQGIFLLSFLPAFALYAYLCKRVPLRKLLWAGTLIVVPQMVPLALIHSATSALLLAVPIGLMGGIAFAAYGDLSMRSCPPGLQGTLMMMVAGGYELSWRGGDMLGAWLYAQSPTNGFLHCVIVTTAVYALILPVLLLIPKELIATADGERNPAVEAEVLAEIGEAAPVAAPN